MTVGGRNSKAAGNSLVQAAVDGALTFGKSALSAGVAVGTVVAWFVDDVLGWIKDELLKWIF